MTDPAFISMLVHLCDVRKPQETTGAKKKPTTHYTLYSTDNKCRFIPLRPDSRLAVAGAIYDAEYKVYLLPDVGVGDRDQLEVKSGPFTGKYTVMGDPARNTGESDVHHISVYAKKQENPGS